MRSNWIDSSLVLLAVLQAALLAWKAWGKAPLSWWAVFMPAYPVGATLLFALVGFLIFGNQMNRHG